MISMLCHRNLCPVENCPSYYQSPSFGALGARACVGSQIALSGPGRRARAAAAVRLEVTVSDTFRRSFRIQVGPGDSDSFGMKPLRVGTRAIYHDIYICYIGPSAGPGVTVLPVGPGSSYHPDFEHLPP